ncbi:ketoacyl-ACP synthase III [Buttiauxella sp. WJP83]|uniref:3-oxoacyl-ACP synthase III family protein n=1 Tax=Buttiauxella sp. WJP83 TaxID=2986951 RepID=UPI0022DE66E3|nr:ketoacyl-ACP synthase III [Buttiauxella sp. WJP83]WBM68819.1 ketoacyl-ACP synthase III [Buttiauxella sp. WJP83]
MRTHSISGINIKAITAAIPSTVMEASDFTLLYGEKNVSRVIRGTGIKSIRVAKYISTTDLMTAAVNNLLNNIYFDKNQIDGLIVITQTPDVWSPGTSFSLHQVLGLSENCFLLDLNSGCSGYANGLIQATALVKAGVCKNVLVCTGDVNSRVIDDKEYQSRMLFGDAASASLITSGEDTFTFVYGTDGQGRKSLGVGMHYQKEDETSGTVGYLKMDGAAVMSFALKRVPEAIDTLLSESNVNKDEIALYALHQPNEFILGYLRDIMSLNDEQLPADVDGIGNTNSTSIPLLLSRKNWSHSRKNIIICGFGVGLSWNAMLINLEKTKIIKPTIVLDNSHTG